MRHDRLFTKPDDDDDVDDDIRKEDDESSLIFEGSKEKRCGKKRWHVVGMGIGVGILLVCLAVGVALAAFLGTTAKGNDVISLPTRCQPNSKGILANFTVVESIPYGLEQALEFPTDVNTTDAPTYNHSTAVAWHTLIEGASQSIDIVCFYMTLNATDDGSDVDGDPEQDLENGHWEGQGIYQDLLVAGQRGVQIRIVESYPTTTINSPSLDIQRLVASSATIEARTLNMTQLINAGIVHNKMMLFDGRYAYLGSANLDWRALTQVKELGLVVESPCLVADLQQQFRYFWKVASTSSFSAIHLEVNSSTSYPVPLTNMGLARKYGAYYSAKQPASVNFVGSRPVNNSQPLSHLYFTSAPQSFCPPDRSYDLDAILEIINHANSSVSISVMDYLPAVIYSTPNYFWPNIDSAIRSAAFNGVNVRMLVSLWNYSIPTAPPYLFSLNDISNVEVRYFVLPPQPDVAPVPYTRVNHCKYLVSEASVLVSTSNWTGDYFTTTTGASAVSDDPILKQQVQAIFDRDWNSNFSYPLNDFLPSSTTL